MSTYMAKPNEVERKWYVVDAAGKSLGRLAVEVADLLRGKNKPLMLIAVISLSLSTLKKPSSQAKRLNRNSTTITQVISVT